MGKPAVRITNHGSGQPSKGAAGRPSVTQTHVDQTTNHGNGQGMSMNQIMDAVKAGAIPPPSPQGQG
jgi:hypothetical protein